MRLNSKEINLNKTTKIIIIFLAIILLILTICKALNIEERVLKYLYPIKFEEYVYKYSRELEIDPMLTFAIIKTESNFREDVISSSGAIGLMQLMENTAKEQAGKLNIDRYLIILWYTVKPVRFDSGIVSI